MASNLRHTMCLLRLCLLFAVALLLVEPTRGQLTLRIEDYAIAPLTGAVNGNSNAASLARINFMRAEPGNPDRMFVNDLNGPLYMFDKQTREFSTYLQFNGDAIGSNPAGMFAKMSYAGGFANGLISFQFDPDYANNGVFYTIHLEELSGGSSVPNNANEPGLDTTGYTPTTAIASVGSTSNPRNAVLIEWTDTNPANSSFEGSARELLRVSHNTRIHPMGDIIFNPNAQPGDDDWRVMYLAVGDGGSGERSGDARLTPQRLDLPTGKILRIIPDLGEHTDSSTVSDNGRYRIPDDNPFADTPGARGEIFALGLRNPHRVSWDDESDTLFVNDIGLFTWEEVNIVHAGANYGYSQREGNQMLLSNNQTTSLPRTDEIPIQLNGTTTLGTVTPVYPVAQYGHEQSLDPIKGDSISSGFVYRGSKVPALYGKYVFGDITTGQLLYADLDELLAADDGDPSTLATIESIDLLWDDPNDSPDSGEELFTTITPSGALLGPLHQIIEIGYHARGGQATHLPGGADTTGIYGRADMRLAVDDEGELYILSKMDGMIRALVGPEPNADFDGSGMVDGRDFLIWQRHLGESGGVSEGDADGDGEITSNDLRVWQQFYGQAVVSSPVAAVPEPSGCSLLLLATGWCLVGKRSKSRQN